MSLYPIHVPANHYGCHLYRAVQYRVILKLWLLCYGRSDKSLYNVSLGVSTDLHNVDMNVISVLDDTVMIDVTGFIE